jgi:hypothetical protein
MRGPRNRRLVHYATGLGGTFSTACGKSSASSYVTRRELAAGVDCPACREVLDRDAPAER